MSTMWFMSMVVLLVVDVRTGALEQDTQPHRCHQCFPTNTTSCQHSETGWLSATCPSARPYCATVALGPDYATSLGCAAAATAPCSLTNSPRQTLELTCICAGHLCNAPFSAKLRNDLLNFSSANNDSALIEAFFKLSNFANISDGALYKAITLEIDGNSTATIEDGGLSGMPKAEALKQQTVPSDDEEDESEGSGADEDSRLHIQGQSASAPAAPSSYLPADQNNACSISTILAPLAIIHLLAY